MEKNVKLLLTNEVMEKVAAFYNLKIEDLYFVGGFENFIYGFKRDDASYIVRITHSSHRSKDDIKAEMDFIFYLASHGARVSTPINTKEEQLTGLIALEDQSYFTVSAFTKAEGDIPRRDNITDKVLFNYGKTIGEFHQLTKNYHVKEGEPKRIRWDEDSIILNAKKYLNKKDDLIITRLQELIREIKEIEAHRDNFGLIHTDIHMGNFFIKDDELSVFDFDDAAYQYFVSDIAIALFYLVFFMGGDARTTLGDHFMTEFMKGYLSTNKISKEDFLTIDLFLKLREIILYIVLFRTVDTEESEFAKKYIEIYRDRIIQRTPFIELDWNKYYIL